MKVNRVILLVVGVLWVLVSQSAAFEKYSGVAFSDSSLLEKQLYFERVSELQGTVIFAWAPSIVPGNGEMSGRSCYYYMAVLGAGVTTEKAAAFASIVGKIANNPNVQYKVFVGGGNP